MKLAGLFFVGLTNLHLIQQCHLVSRANFIADQTFAALSSESCKQHKEDKLMALKIFAYHGFTLLLVALLVRFGGNFPMLAGSKWYGIKDMAAYNRWAGNRLLLLPLATFVIAWFSLGSLAAKTFGLMLLWAVIIAVLVWVCTGVKKFQ